MCKMQNGMIQEKRMLLLHPHVTKIIVLVSESP